MKAVGLKNSRLLLQGLKGFRSATTAREQRRGWFLFWGGWSEERIFLLWVGCEGSRPGHGGLGVWDERTWWRWS